MFVLLLAIPVEEDDTVVEREDRLEDRTNEIGRDGDRRQERVGAHIQDDSQEGRHEYDDRFEPGLRHDEEDEHDHDRRDDHDGDRGRGAILAGLYDAVATETVADLLAELFLVHRLGHVEVEDGVGTIVRITISDALYVWIGL